MVFVRSHSLAQWYDETVIYVARQTELGSSHTPREAGFKYVLQGRIASLCGTETG
jgi:hypothetical protein